MNAINVGVIGAGKMGLSHLAILKANKDVNVTGVCDNASYITGPLAKNAGIKTYKSFDKMADESALDCVVVSTPTSTHFEIAKKALLQGLNVFVEKPLCLDPAHSQELARLADTKSLITQVGYHNRFIGTFQEARRIVSSGLIGSVYHVDGKAFGQVVTRRKEGRTWRSKKVEGGGCLHDYACHVLDLMNFVVGPPSHVAHAHLKSIFSSEIEDAVYANLLYKDGSTGALETNWSDDSHRKMTTTITVYGENGKISADRQELRVYLKATDSAHKHYKAGWTIRYITELQKPVSFYLRGEEYSAQLDNFVGAIRDKRNNDDYSFVSAAQTDTLIDAIQAKASN